MPSIFDRAKLTAAQLRTAADRRMGDAEALRDTRQNARSNGAIYLGGFVLECLLKAKLLEKHPWIGSAGSPEGRSAADRRLWSLAYRQHDLTALLDVLPSIPQQIQRLEPRDAGRLAGVLAKRCGEWSVFARYSPRTATMLEAKLFLSDVRELRPWLRSNPGKMWWRRSGRSTR